MLKMDKVMQESMLYARDCNLFGTGPPRHVPPGPWKRRRLHDMTTWKEASETEIRSPSGDVRVNPDLLSFLQIGGDRVERYFNRFPMEGDRKDVKRSESKKENGVALTKIEATYVQAKTNQANSIDKYVSLDKIFLMTRGLFSAAECKRDLDDLNNQLVIQAGGDESVRIKVTKNDRGKVNKECFVVAIIALRKKLIAGNALWVELRKLELTKDDDSEADIEAKRLRALNSVYFNGEGTAARARHEATKYSFEGTNTSNGSDDDDDSDDGNNGEPMSQLSEATGQPSQDTVSASQNTTSSSPSTGFHKRSRGDAGLGSFRGLW